MKSEPRSVSMKSEPVNWTAPRSAPPPAPRSMPEYYRDPVPAEPTGTHHQHDSPSARAMSEDSSRISMHSRARTAPRYGGSISSSSVKSEPPSVKSERPPSVNPMVISLPGSSVGTRSIKSESETQGLVGSYSGSHRGSLGSRTSYGQALTSASGAKPARNSGSTSASGGSIGPALSGRTSYGQAPSARNSGSSVGSNQTPRRSGSLSTLQYAGGSSGGSSGGSNGGSSGGSSSRRTSRSRSSMSNIISMSSRVLSEEDRDALYYSYHPPSAKGRPTSRDDIWPLRPGRTLEVPERRPGYVAETRARRRV